MSSGYSNSIKAPTGVPCKVKHATVNVGHTESRCTCTSVGKLQRKREVTIFFSLFSAPAFRLVQPRSTGLSFRHDSVDRSIGYYTCFLDTRWNHVQSYLLFHISSELFFSPLFLLEHIFIALFPSCFGILLPLCTTPSLWHALRVIKISSCSYN